MLELFEILRQRGMMIVTAESCTGGLIAKTITDFPGASSIFERGFVTYSNESKEELLAVPHDILTRYGAVSAEVASAMAEGALGNSRAHIAIACTGLAGPGGGTNTKPVGLVYIGLAMPEITTQSFEHHFKGDRISIRTQTVEAAFRHVRELLK
ncbi:MAG: damage-inducible protein CinA [Alphaproteobacteria bacterium CG_4_9_14_3_um_filter_47_13]|nr:MAG: damage-inducible protein CinA [Alphaproteobacteria bacterium CG_4_9_14_3_um_filter_47_13]